MKHNTAAFSAIFVIACFAVVACQSMPTTLPPGEYTKTESHTAASGTQTTKETTTDVYYDQYGNKHSAAETDVTRDPPGLLNKTTTKTTTMN